MDIPKDPCPKCNGKGVMLNKDDELIDFVCPRCKGEGELDWIERAMGPRDYYTLRELYNYCKEIWSKEENMGFDFPFNLKGVEECKQHSTLEKKDEKVNLSNQIIKLYG